MSINQRRTYLRFKSIQWFLRLLGFTIYHNPSTNVYIATRNNKWYRSRVDIILQDCKYLSDDELDEVIDRIHQIYSHYPISQGCKVPPKGWFCTREVGHSGPCAAMKGN